MSPEMMLAAMEMTHAPDVLHADAHGRKRNLGGAVVLAAIEDYRGTDHKAHKDAKQFLYPCNDAEMQAHFEWVVAVADGMNRAWLRDTLDRMRGQWDHDRQRKLATRKARCGR